MNLIDEAARTLLEQTEWVAPDPEALPTGGEIVRHYLEPLAAHPAIAPHLLFGAEVFSIRREGLDKVTTPGREAVPFVIHWRDGSGRVHQARAQAVVDASGTWFSPNPMGIDGGFIQGEQEASARIAYGIPDVLGELRTSYAGARVLVVGGGHSAINVVLDLLRLQEIAPETRVVWAQRHNRLEKLLGGGLNDQLPARGALGLAAKQAIEAGRLQPGLLCRRMLREVNNPMRIMSEASPGTPRSGERLFIAGLGVGQIISWGTLYYSFPLIAEAMGHDLGLTKPQIYGAATIGLLIASFTAYTGVKERVMRLTVGTWVMAIAAWLTVIFIGRGCLADHFEIRLNLK